jgi:hypothetical protein
LGVQYQLLREAHRKGVGPDLALKRGASFEEILARMNTILEEKKAHEEQERKRLRAEFLAKVRMEEPRLWCRVDELIGTRDPKSYDHAVRVLKALEMLWKSDGKQEAYLLKMLELRKRYSRLAGLKTRMGEAGLFADQLKNQDNGIEVKDEDGFREDRQSEEWAEAVFEL